MAALLFASIAGKGTCQAVRSERQMEVGLQDFLTNQGSILRIKFIGEKSKLNKHQKIEKKKR